MASQALKLVDEPSDVRDSETIEGATLKALVAEAFPETYAGGPISLKQFGGGASNLTYLVSFEGREVILRRPPFGTKAKTAHDMGREFRILEAVHPHFDRCPKPLAVGDETSALGSPYYFMERIKGIIPRKDLGIEVSPGEARALCENLVETQVALHGLDVEATGLIELGKPVGYIERQVKGWNDRYRAARTEDVPRGEWVMRWLAENRPADTARPALIHNDFKFDNVVLDPADPLKVIGVLDWELTTIGDPLMDLGCSLAYWVERSDPMDLKAIRMLPTHLKGMMTRAEVVAHYAEKSGTQINDFTFYRVFGLFRLAGIAQQIYYRFKKGQTDNPRFAGFGFAVNAMIKAAEREIQDADRARSKPAYLSKIGDRSAFDLTGKRALITGASRGIGEAAAKLLAAHGAHVIVSSRKAEGVDRVAKEIAAAGGSAEAIPCHIGEIEPANQLFETLDAAGGIDILINNAAANPYFGPIVDTPLEAFDKTVDVNIRGYFYMSQLGARSMRERGGGVIINTASVNGVKAAPFQGIYSVTKSAVIAMTEAFAKEVAEQNIRVNAVLPGLTDTKFASALTQNEAMLQMVMPQIPLGRVADPEEIAPAFLYLASDAAAYVTGVSLTVDGGYLT